jgi:alkanesulfonate monooxygenase SsuD/methylene tetrahydromethanopterin reductase-like flavin-dependent oxidoreductase (luciferase family)
MGRYMEANLAVQAMTSPTAVSPRIRRDVDPVPVDQLVEQGRLIAGTPAECIAMIERLQAEIGFTLLCCQFQFGGIDFPTARRSMELFAREVIPRLRGASAPTPLEVHR